MTVNDEVKFVEIMRYLSACFPEREVNQDTVQVYFDAFVGYDIEQIWKAARAYAKKADRFPYISDIISHLGT